VITSVEAQAIPWPRRRTPGPCAGDRSQLTGRRYRPEHWIPEREPAYSTATAASRSRRPSRTRIPASRRPTSSACRMCHPAKLRQMESIPYLQRRIGRRRRPRRASDPVGGSRSNSSAIRAPLPCRILGSCRLAADASCHRSCSAAVALLATTVPKGPQMITERTLSMTVHADDTSPLTWCFNHARGLLIDRRADRI
jgi:hypothetical protein